MTSSATKRSRASQEQLSHMVDFMYENPGFTGSNSLKFYGRMERDRIWSELAQVLNSLGGAVKTVEQWQTVWKDLKCRTSIKVRSRKGQRGSNHEPIIDIEKRVIAVIGRDYIESNDLDKDLEYEEEISLETPATKTPETTEIPQRGTKRLRDDSEIQQKLFDEIAAKQADTLKILADTAATHTEVVSKQAEAIKLLAECSAVNLDSAKAMADALKSVNEGVRAVADAINNLARTINRKGNLSCLLKRLKRSEAPEVNMQSPDTEPNHSKNKINCVTENVENLENGDDDSPIVIKFEVDESY